MRVEWLSFLVKVVIMGLCSVYYGDWVEFRGSAKFRPKGFG